MNVTQHIGPIYMICRFESTLSVDMRSNRTLKYRWLQRSLLGPSAIGLFYAVLFV